MYSRHVRGSRRIPRKNVRSFAGKPIIAHSIEAARASALFERVIVSTDDDEIARVARDCGAETPFVRPAELADDHTGTNAVVRHAISWFGERGALPHHVCCLYATAPLVQPCYLREGFERLIASGKSFAFSVTSYAFPIQRALRIDADGCVEPIWPGNIARRSQDLGQTYHDAGQFYWGTARAFLDDVVLYSAASVPVVLPRHLVQDIDTEEDWRRAEFLYTALQAAGELHG